MKRRLLIVLVLVASCVLSTNAATRLSSYHYYECQELGVVVESGESAEMKYFGGYEEEAPNGQRYFFCYEGIMFDMSKPLGIGYRFADHKMYVYDKTSGTETVVYDFNLQPGDNFTTMDNTQWKVTGREERRFVTGEKEYDAVHTVLQVESADGTLKDEWIENVGAVRRPIQLLQAGDMPKAHVAYFRFSWEIPYLALDFGDDPLYGCFAGSQELGPEHNDKEYISSVTMAGDTVQIDLQARSYGLMQYFYGYRKGNDFNIKCHELGPQCDCGLMLLSFHLEFPHVPSDKLNYSVTVDGDRLTTGISTAPHAAPRTKQMTDIQGRPISKKPANGVYISNGQKYLAK